MNDENYKNIVTDILKEHQNYIINICTRELKEFNDKELLKDTIQDIYLKVFVGYREFKGECDIKTWLYRITINTCIDVKRAKSRLVGKQEALDDVIDNIGREEEGYKQIEQEYDRLNIALEQLNSQQREVVEMLFYKDLSVKEIAKKVGKTENNIYQILHRARIKLKKMFKGKGGK